MNGEIVIYPGSFDPPTYGHMNIVERALKIFKKVVVAVATNTSKSCLLTPAERVELFQKIFRGRKNIQIDQFDGLLAEYAKRKGVRVILRGLRTVADYEYELQMAFSNKNLHPEMETLFMMTESQFSHISSTIIKEIAHFGGSVRSMVHPEVAKKLQAKLQRRVSSPS